MAGNSTLPNYFTTQWDNAVRATAQQTESRLRSLITDIGQVTGESFTINTDGVLDDFTPNLVRHSDTEFDELPAMARLVPMQDFFKALPLDRNDIPKLLLNPVTGGRYMKALMNMKNRKIDAIIYAALMGTVTTKAGDTITLPTSQKIVSGGTGLTKAKLIQAITMFRANEADSMNGETLSILYNSVALGEILSDTTLTNNQFLQGQMLQEGKLAGSFLGFNWVPYERLNNNAGTYSTVAFAKSSVEFGTGFEEGSTDKRPDKKNLTQVSMAASYGAGRTDEVKVVQIDFT